MKSGDTVISVKDHKAEILVLMGGYLYGNRTGFSYGKMEDEDKKETTDEEGSSEEPKKEEEN